MNRNYNQYDDDSDYIFYDTNDDSSYSDDLIYEDNNNDFKNIDSVEYDNYNNYDYNSNYTYDASKDNDNYDYDYDYAYEDDSTDDYKENNILFENRTKIVTGIIIVTILLLIAWITPQFINRNKKTTSEVTLTKKIDTESDMSKLKQAALKYYEENSVPANVNETNKLSLKELLDKKLIKNISSSYNKKKSYIKLTKLEDDFLLEIQLVKDKVIKKEEYYINNYSYCTSTYLCEKEDIMDPNQSLDSSEDEETVEVENTESGDSDTANYQYEYSKTENGKLSDWSSWSDYSKTSCTTKAITCKSDDFNCLSETKLYNRKEKLGTTSKQYNTSRNSYTFISQEIIKGCPNYDYAKVNNVYYKTSSINQFTSIGTFSTASPTNHGAWTYLGRKTYQTPPSDSIKTRYVFVDSERYCENCSSSPSYTYDMYQFNGNLQIVNNINAECPKQKNQRNIPTYNISYQSVSVNRTETLYGTVCYKSERTRKITKQGKTKTTWSNYDNEKLLNSGYTYTGNKKER